jgi:hypothetical protein
MQNEDKLLGNEISEILKGEGKEGCNMGGFGELTHRNRRSKAVTWAVCWRK